MQFHLHNMRKILILPALFIALLAYACTDKRVNGNAEKIAPANKDTTICCIDTVINTKRLRIYPFNNKIVFESGNQTDTLYYPYEAKYNIAIKNIWKATGGKTMNSLVYGDYFLFSFGDLGYLKHLAVFNLATGKLIKHDGAEMFSTNFPVFILEQNKIITAEEPDMANNSNNISVTRYGLMPNHKFEVSKQVIQDPKLFHFHDFDTANFRRFLNLQKK